MVSALFYRLCLLLFSPEQGQLRPNALNLVLEPRLLPTTFLCFASCDDS